MCLFCQIFSLLPRFLFFFLFFFSDEAIHYKARLVSPTLPESENGEGGVCYSIKVLQQEMGRE